MPVPLCFLHSFGRDDRDEVVHLAGHVFLAGHCVGHFLPDVMPESLSQPVNGHAQVILGHAEFFRRFTRRPARAVATALGLVPEDPP